MSFENIYTIVKKEIKSYLINPATYIMATVFVVVWEFLFFQNVFLIGEASVQGLFSLLLWFFLLLIPAVTMGSISEEKNKDTLEVLLTNPMSDWELVFGKFFSALLFVAALLLASLPVVISLNMFGDVDMGAYIGQYFASVLLTSVFVSLGIAVSSFFKSQIPALMLSVMGIFLLIISGFDIVTMSLPEWLSPVFSRLSVYTHYNSLARGLIDLRDVWYFVFLTAIFLFIAHTRLVLRRYGKSTKEVMKERATTLSILIVFLITSGLGFAPVARLDLTEGDIYTLTDVTKETLSNLPKEITITLYTSNNLPAQFQPIVRNVKDVLSDYASYGGSNIRVEYKNPDDSEDVANEAVKNGITLAQANLQSQGEFNVKQFYFGIAVKSDKESKAIPFISDTSDLEYKLTSFISELTKTDKKEVVFVYGKDESPVSAKYSNLSDELKKQFLVKDVMVSEGTTTLIKEADVIVFAGKTDMFDKTKADVARKAFSMSKNMLVLEDAISVNPQYMLASLNGTSTDDVLSEYGISVDRNMVYDLRSNKNISVGGRNGITYITPYPQFVVANVDRSVISKLSVPYVVMPWSSSVTVNKDVLAERGFESFPLIFTTEYAGAEIEKLDIDPQVRLPQINLGVKNIGILVRPKDSDGESADGNKSRLVVIGDSDFLADGSITPENLAFGMDVISYLAQESSLAGIRIKQNMSRPLLFGNKKEVAFVRYGNMGGIAVLIMLIGVIVLGRRKKLKNKTYNK